ncbi:hypothetical protein AB6A40_010311 [Gnathostoma spinigerum]|uniref:Uncharacterized protein n=1 Tax=Gnathostoma spinigerum TaxID=75299 RepID=A0ABD6F2H4_9BILA
MQSCRFRYPQDEILQYNLLSPEEDYCIPLPRQCPPEPYVRCQMSFEDPQIDKNAREANDAMYEVHDYLALKLEAMHNDQAHNFPRLFSKEWDELYARYCPDNDSKDRRRFVDSVIVDNDDDQIDEKRARKRVPRLDKMEKAKKMKYNRE